MKKLLLLFVIVSLTLTTRADDGMWLPMLLKNNIGDMNTKGFKLTAEDLYSINQSSLKDAVVGIPGCTAEVVSDEGLILTNHHCGFNEIQFYSTVENNYLAHGFWAMTRSEELPGRNMTARFLVRMTDVTPEALKKVSDKLTENKRQQLIDKNIEAIIKQAKEAEPQYVHSVSAMFNGNQYILFTYEVFEDVRLVGAPPVSIGKFGGETDNWMWPRHTGDFAIFRIYAGKDNKPAKYSPDNVPYKPKRHLTISLKGIQKDDFTMVYGYPGRTQEYLPSYALKNVIELSDPDKIALRTIRLNLMNKYQMADPKVNIQYAAKNASVANGWKKWRGELAGFNRVDVIAKKQTAENEFMQWVAVKADRKKEYGDLLPQFERLYTQIRPYTKAIDYYNEAFRAIEMVSFVSNFKALIDQSKDDKYLMAERLDLMKQELKPVIVNFYKDYYVPYDRELFGIMLSEYYKNVPVELRPEIIEKLYQDYQGDFEKLANTVYAGSVFVNDEWVKALTDTITNDNIKAIESDFFYQLWDLVTADAMQRVQAPMNEIAAQLSVDQRKYMKALMEQQSERHFYPDANSTLRVAYGQVGGYKPHDAVMYDYYSTLDGIIEKSNTGNKDYIIPEKLRALWKSKDYGVYGMSTGQMPVAFIANNHTTGGNSGSPILNAYGELVGINFDRCWEGTMSDYIFDPGFCRNIGVDIRYVLFIIDRFAGAKHLLDEMTIVHN